MEKEKQTDYLVDLYHLWEERINANPNLTIEDERIIFEGWGDATYEPEGVMYKTDHVAGYEGIWSIPQNADTSKVLLFFHGGGFVTGSASSHRKLAGHLAKELNVLSLAIDYRLAPEHKFPAQLNDALAVYKELLNEGYKPENIGTSGDSAGGALAVTSVVYFEQNNLPLPGFIISISPWLDMEVTGKTYDTNDDKDALLSKEMTKRRIRTFLEDGDVTDPIVNALYADLSNFPPLYITVGGDEVLVDDARMLYNKAKKEGVQTELSIVDDMQHIFPILAGRDPKATEEIQRMGEWFKSL